MANPEHLEILKQGVEEWNRWRQERPDIKPDLSGADLRGIDFNDSKFTVVNIPHNISGLALTRANFSNVSFSCADIRNANIRMADLSGADLSGADLTFAVLSQAALHETILSE
jgi:uncharacterized protein YjbI with pentapeptide repeats